MSHADALRTWAAQCITPTARAPFLAGADALDTLERMRAVLTEIDRLDDDAWAVWKRDADMYEQGRSDAYEHALTLITEALEGDTP